MEIEKIHELIFEEKIETATLSNSNKIVMLMSSGSVITFNLIEENAEYLFSTKSNFSFEDGGFDTAEKSTIYTLDEIVVIANDFKRHAYIHYPKKYKALHLWRENYGASNSCYPIAMFKDDKDVSHIIYAASWNHIQIMNLDTRQILTAAKSLIEENAEEDHIEFYKKYNEDTKLPWPSRYDYFFGKLHVSPNKKYFLSAGWVWGSYDSYRIYNIDRFINNNRISDIIIDGWQHENRSVCWIDDQTIVVGYDPKVEEEEGGKIIDMNADCEFHFYNFIDEKVELNKKVKIENLDIVNAIIQFNSELNSIVTFSEKFGVAVISLDGNIKYSNASLKVDSYLTEVNLFLTINDKTIIINKLTE